MIDLLIQSFKKEFYRLISSKIMKTVKAMSFSSAKLLRLIRYLAMLSV
ncbi:hypothetical protein LV89_02042 [Arcicella aurantiaca]|uniref:Uncharacterized protein n=1 Tax=Arcicella aurantiaca TaxID=591202 RepID=A0A316EAZ7_9BACT|nr:hypothetical protein LV89_02042 [Arcicella aurantiaca]